MTTDERIAQFAGLALPMTTAIQRQLDQLEEFMTSIAYRKGSGALRAAILTERAAVIDAFVIADAKERAAARQRAA